MRKASTLAGLALFAVTASAFAQEAPVTVDSTVSPDRARATPILSDPIGAKPPSPRERIQLGVAFVSMGLGKMAKTLKGVRETSDALFAYGLGLTVDYRILPGLTLGIAPQAILNVQAKDSLLGAARQIDLLARVAYARRIAEGSCIYAEVLPGYSLVIIDDLSKGLVIVVGAGVTVDVTSRGFVNFGLGYQKGFQKFEGDDSSTTYVRATLGGGSRF